MAKTGRKEKKEIVIYTSLIINDNFIAEQVYTDKGNQFCVYTYGDKEQIDYKNELIIGGLKHKPLFGEEIRKKAIHLPSKAQEYESDEKLDEEIKSHVHEWLDVPPDVLQFAVWNIKRSWVFERFHTLNYLRALGDTGQGKSRFLDVLGYLHYKPIATSGATTAAPVFRIINKWKGTLIMDEADFQKSDEAQDIIKIINQGYERGRHIMRCDKENSNKINFFDPFCPKILATRKTFYDKAVESRCITQVMTGTSRKDIRWNLNAAFWKKTEEIRNKLLMWRFRNYHKINPDKNIDLNIGDLEPRVQQIVGSFISLFGDDKKQLEGFKDFIKKYQEELIDERRSSFEGNVVSAIYSLLEDKKTNISALDIIIEGNITNSKGVQVKPRGLSSTIKALGFGKAKQTKVDDKNKRCIPLNKDHLVHLFTRYGYDKGNAVTVVTVITLQRELLQNTQKEGGSDRTNRYNRKFGDESLPEGKIEEEQIFDTIHAKCTTCGQEPSHIYNKQGEPMCETCYKAKEANK